MWIVTDGREYRVTWPAGYTAEFNPMVVFDERGRVVARAGDTLHFLIQSDVGEPDACGRVNVAQVAFQITGP